MVCVEGNRDEGDDILAKSFGGAERRDKPPGAAAPMATLARGSDGSDR